MLLCKKYCAYKTYATGKRAHHQHAKLVIRKHVIIDFLEREQICIVGGFTELARGIQSLELRQRKMKIPNLGDEFHTNILQWVHSLDSAANSVSPSTDLFAS